MRGKKRNIVRKLVHSSPLINNNLVQEEREKKLVPTNLSVIVALMQGTRAGILYAFDEKIIMEVANKKRDLRRDGGSGPAETVGMGH